MGRRIIWELRAREMEEDSILTRCCVWLPIAWAVLTSSLLLSSTLVVQWLGLHALPAEALGSMPGRGTKNPTGCMMQPKQTNKHETTTKTPKNSDTTVSKFLQISPVLPSLPPLSHQPRTCFSPYKPQPPTKVVQETPRIWERNPGLSISLMLSLSKPQLRSHHFSALKLPVAPT